MPTTNSTKLRSVFECPRSKQPEFGSDRSYSSASGSNSCANSLNSTEGINADQPDLTTADTASRVPNMRSDQTNIESSLPDAAPTSSPGIPQTSHKGPDMQLSSGTTNDGKNNLTVDVVNKLIVLMISPVDALYRVTCSNCAII